MAEHRVGVMQGRLSPRPEHRLQAFPHQCWPEEFALAKRLGFSYLEWIYEAERAQENPIASAKGGRAYYGQQTISSWINGKRDTVGDINGTEALPQGINATMFKHDSRSDMNCEWVLAQEGKDITMCNED